MIELTDPPRATRGTTNRNDRGSAEDRRRRRAWMMLVWVCDVVGFVRCYRCGRLLFNPDAPPKFPAIAYLRDGARVPEAQPLTVDRIIPGCKGGTYRRNNIRPACGGCNSETGGALSGSGKQKP